MLGPAEALRQPGAGRVGVQEQHGLAGGAPAASHSQRHRARVEAGSVGGQDR